MPFAKQVYQNRYPKVSQYITKFLMPLNNVVQLQLIATEPKLQISTIKAKYLASFHFACILN
jgi:hypothetical protein